MKKSNLLLLGLLIVLAPPILGATPPAKTPTAPSAETQQAERQLFSATPFSGVITPGFLGNDAKAIFSALKQSVPPKSEFETTAQYEKRKLEAEAKPLYGSIQRNSLLSFVPPSEDSTNGNFKPRVQYDAYEQVLHIKVENYKLDVLNRPRVYVGFNKTEDELLSLILQREESSSNHTGENVFGATMNVTAFRIKELAIAYDPNTAPNFYDFAIPLTPEKAQSVKPRVRMLIIGKLASPPIFEGTSYFGATLDASMSFHDDYSYIHLTIEDVWVFDSATGEILAKASAR